MRKFWVIFFSVIISCTLVASMVFVFATRETIELSAKVLYVNVGQEVPLSVNKKHGNNATTISASSSDSSIASYSNGLCVAKAGGVARITFSTSNSRFRNLHCDVNVGDGSVENPYYISTAEELMSIGSADSAYPAGANYKLVNDIDMSVVADKYWTPIAEFEGTFDGNGYTISNIVINNNESNEIMTNAGLFGVVGATSTIVNLKVVNFYCVGEFVNVGVIAGVNNGTIDRVEVRDAFLDVTAENIGGIAGQNMTADSSSIYGTTMTAVISKSSADVIIGQTQKVTNSGVTYVNKGATGNIGGIAGQNIGGTISNTYSKGKVVLGETGIIYGGIVGNNEYLFTSTANASNSYVSSGKIENSYSSIALFPSKVTNYSSEAIGGVVGKNMDILEEVESNGVVIKLNSNNLNGLYYDKDKLNNSETNKIKVFTGVGSNLIYDKSVENNNITEKSGYVLGYTSNGMKVMTNYKSNAKTTEIYNTNGTLITTRTSSSNWDFENVWVLDGNANNGYPELRYTYVEESEDDNNTYSYIILNTYELTLAQGDYTTQKEVKGLASIIIKDSNGKKVTESTSSNIRINMVEGFRIATSSKGIVVYDLDNKIYYTIEFAIAGSTYKFNSIELSDSLITNGGRVDSDCTATIWFRNTNHTLTIINAETGRTIKTATVTEGTSLQSQINSVLNSMTGYKYVRFNTVSNGTGATYTASSRMPNKDLTLYVIVTRNNTTNPDIDPDIEPSDPDVNPDIDPDYGDAYQINSVETWNNYVAKYATSSSAKFVQTRSFTIDSSFKSVSELAGTYDGNGYTITVRGTLRNFAIFKSIRKGATVTGLNVQYSSATIKSVEDDYYFGGIANQVKGSIEECSVSGTINLDFTVEKGVGGLVGLLAEGKVVDSANSAKINAISQSVAGIVGVLKKGNIEECTNSGAIVNNSESIYDYEILQHGTVISAGIVGYLYGSSTKIIEGNTNSGKIVSSISGCNDGAVSAGIAGYCNNATITDNVNKGTIESEYQSGGIVAFVNGGTISSNYNYGNITAETSNNTNVAAGGIVGKIHDSGKITNNSHMSGMIIAKTVTRGGTEAFAGGIIGCMFYGGSASGNTLGKAVNISVSGYYAYVGGGCGKVTDANFASTKFVSGWSTNASRYLSANGVETHINYNTTIAY